jgi:hypothetical protein
LLALFGERETVKQNICGGNGNKWSENNKKT